MHKLDAAIQMLDKYRKAASTFVGYGGSCALSAIELDTIISLLEDTRTNLVLESVRAPG